MARKKKEKAAYGWDEEDKDEALRAEGLKRTQMDDNRVELVDRDTSTPYIETYDEETGELEGAIYLKNGNRTGLLAQVKIIEEVKVEQDHDATPESIGFSGKLDVVNPRVHLENQQDIRVEHEPRKYDDAEASEFYSVLPTCSRFRRGSKANCKPKCNPSKKWIQNSCGNHEYSKSPW